MAYLMATTVMTLSDLEGNSLLQAFSSVIFRICGASRGTSAFAGFLVHYIGLYLSILVTYNPRVLELNCCVIYLLTRHMF